MSDKYSEDVLDWAINEANKRGASYPQPYFKDVRTAITAGLIADMDTAGQVIANLLLAIDGLARASGR